MNDEGSMVYPFLCPWCFDIADVLAIEAEGEVLVWVCLSCYHQGIHSDFIEID